MRQVVAPSQSEQQPDEVFEQVARVAGIDIAKASGMVCLRVPDEDRLGRRIQQIQSVPATTGGIIALADHLVCQSIELVVMEATGVYWKPFFYLLEDRGLTVWLVNPRDVKNVPSRPKTDKLDAIWLAKLAERGMLRASFVPTEPERRLRDLTRLRRTLVQDRTKHRQRVADVLQDACLKIADRDEGITDLFGVTGRAMLEALDSGERDPKALAGLAKGLLKKKTAYLTGALTGRFTDHHARQIRTLLALHDHLDAEINQLTDDIEVLIAELDPTGPPDPDHPDRRPLLDRLDEIPGVSREIAADILGETGFDMTRFPTGGHLASWAKLTPRTIQSGAKNSHGGTGKGNPWIKGPLGQAAVATGRTKTFLGARYRRIIKHAPKKKAVTAVARNILEIVWALAGDPDARFTDLGTDWHTRHIDEARKTRQHVRELEHLGYTVTLAKPA
jgi:transposase